MIMQGVREYTEEYPVELIRTDLGRVVIQALNEGGYNITQVDLVDLLDWIKRNAPVVDSLLNP